MDNIYIWMGVLFFIGIFVYAIWVVIAYSRHKKLSSKQKKYFEKLLWEISKEKSPQHQIINYDKLYHKILLGLWYQWSFWEILKSVPNEISDIETIWNIHKLRNKIVHEFHASSDSDLKAQAKKYHKNISSLLKKI